MRYEDVKTFFDAEDDRVIEGLAESSLIEKIMLQLGLFDVLPTENEFDPDSSTRRVG